MLSYKHVWCRMAKALNIFLYGQLNWEPSAFLRWYISQTVSYKMKFSSVSQKFKQIVKSIIDMDQLKSRGRCVDSQALVERVSRRAQETMMKCSISAVINSFPLLFLLSFSPISSQCETGGEPLISVCEIPLTHRPSVSMSWQASRSSSPAFCWNPISVPLYSKPFLSGSLRGCETSAQCYAKMNKCANIKIYLCVMQIQWSKFYMGLTSTEPSLNHICQHCCVHLGFTMTSS